MRIGLLAVNWRAPADQAPRMRTPVAARNASLSGVEASSVKKRLQVLAIVEDEGAVHDGHRRVQRAQRRRPLDVDVDVAGRDRCDTVGVAA